MRLTLLLIIILFMFPVKAEGNSNNGILVSPSLIIIEQNDIGRDFEIKITNNTSETRKIIINECLGIRENGEFKISENGPKSSSLDLKTKEIILSSKDFREVPVRVRLSAYTDINTYPCLELTSTPNSTSDQLTITSKIVVPFLLQHYKSEHSLSLNTSLDKNGLITKKDITISGEIINNGETFYEISGTIIISQNGKKLKETEISTQINGLIFPEDKKIFDLKWKNPLEDLESIGEYTVETRIKILDTGKVFTNKIYFNYIPENIIVFGIITAASLVAILLGILVIKKKRKIKKTA